MCTASWSFGSKGTVLCFNRDERKTRPRATPPEIFAVGERRCLAPRDALAKGTWLLVNDLGLCVFVLNNYAATAKEPSGCYGRSRGDLPLALAGYGSVGEAVEAFLDRGMAVGMAPFHLCALNRKEARCVSWDGESVSERGVGEGFITTSSFRTVEVEAYRGERFRELLPGRGADREGWHLGFHRDLAHPDPAFNPFMLRPESETHCLSLVVLTENEARFDYQEREPDRPIWRPVQGEVLPFAS